MKEQITAKIYAASFLELAEEDKIDLAKELTTLTETINSSNDLENVLFLDVFTTEEKITVMQDIAAKINLDKSVHNMVAYLINEKRITLLPLIFKEVIVIDDEKKGFLRGTIEGHDESISDESKNILIAEVKRNLGKAPDLKYIQNKSISAGYRVTVEDLQLDATMENQLNKFKESVFKNE